MKNPLSELPQLVFTVILYLLGIVVMGLALFPGVFLCFTVWMKLTGNPLAVRVLALSLGMASGFFLYGVSLIGIVGILRILLGWNLKEGEYPIPSMGAVQWACANALQLIVTITFMDFLLLTPLAPLFYCLMGARVGRHVQINSKYCADLSLLEIGDYSVIGGHATVIGHSFERGRLILKGVKIGRGVTIGLNSIVLPGAEIGDGAVVAAGAIVPKNKKVEPHTTYYGG